MVSSPTASNRFNKQGTGDNVNAWGTYLNVDMDLVDAALDGQAAITLTTGTVVLTAQNYLADQARNRQLVLTGSLTGNVVIQPPANATKWYLIVNNCTMNGYTITFAPALGTAVTLAQGAQIVWTDGQNGYSGQPTLDQVPAPVGAVSMAGQKLINIGAPSNNNDAATKSYVDNTAWNLNTGILPGQTGNAGKVLTTNGTTASWGFSYLALGTTVTASTTLTASSQIVPVQMVASGQAVTLPNATTLQLGGPQLIIDNTQGLNHCGVRDNTGTLIAALAPGGFAILILDNNSTAAGSWSVTGSKLESVFPRSVSSQYYTINSTNYWQAGNFIVFIGSVSVSGGTPTGNLAVLIDLTTGQVSTPVAIPTSSQGIFVPLSATQAVFLYNATQCCVITVSGSPGSFTLSVGTMPTTPGTGLAFSTNGNQIIGVAAISATQFLVAYQPTSTTTSICTATVSGSTITFNTGGAVALPAGTPYTPALLPLTTTTFLVAYKAASAGTLPSYAVLTVTGNNCALGSAVAGTITTSSTATCPGRWLQISSSKYMFLMDGNGSNGGCDVVTVSGTTVSVHGSVISPVPSPVGTSWDQPPFSYLSLFSAGSTNLIVLLVLQQSSNSQYCYAYLLSETSGATTITAYHNADNATPFNSISNGHGLVGYDGSGTALMTHVTLEADTNGSFQYATLKTMLVPIQFTSSSINFGVGAEAPLGATSFGNISSFFSAGGPLAANKFVCADLGAFTVNTSAFPYEVIGDAAQISYNYGGKVLGQSTNPFVIWAANGGQSYGRLILAEAVK